MTESYSELEELVKLPTGVGGFDQIGEGGIPGGRCTIVAGTAGSGKTVLALQYLTSAARRGEGGVLVTFEERPVDLVRNAGSLGFGLAGLIEAGKISVVDASPEPGESIVEAGDFDLSALMARIEHAANRVDARHAVIDSAGAIFPQFTDANIVRRELHRIVTGLREMGITTLMTVERESDEGPIARFGVEEFVADNVIILRNNLDQEKRRRTIEILKYRGATHQKGEYPFSIYPKEGITIVPISAIELRQRSSDVRISSGNRVLDEMCGGGMFRDSIILVSGATGTGKTLMVTQFMDAAVRAGQKALLFAFEESRQQLIRNATSWGIDFLAAEKAGLLRVVCRYPEAMGLEDHMILMKREIEDFGPDRVAVDSMSALERVSSIKSFREFVIGITSHIKHQDIAGMFTNTTSILLGGETITETHISTITDSIVLLRYVELQAQMRRGLTVLKMRGSWHDKDIREYVIDNQGMHVREPFRNISGILRGQPTHMMMDERTKLGGMFPDSQ